jgi:histidyl-tRNA synthetase
VKLWYLSSFFRAEAPQRGRYRQFWQVGAEAIGSDAPETDAELIVLLVDLIDALGTRHDRLRLSSLGTPTTRAAYRELLTTYLRTHESELTPEVRNRIDLNPMRAFDSSDARTQGVMREAPKLIDHLDDADTQHFAQVRALLDGAGVAYELDPTLVRGMDYYTRTVFEFTSDALGAQSGVGGGGRYDGLIELLDGPPTPACGWAAGVERMLLAAGELPTAPELVDLFVALAKRDRTRAAFELVRKARRAGLQAQLELAGRSLKGQLKHADRIGARYVAIIGDNGAATLKDMESGEQRDTELQDVIPTILRGHPPL